VRRTYKRTVSRFVGALVVRVRGGVFFEKSTIVIVLIKGQLHLVVGRESRHKAFYDMTLFNCTVLRGKIYARKTIGKN